MSFEDILQEVSKIAKEDISYFNRCGVKSPMLARIQKMWKMDNEDFEKALRELR